MFTKWFGNLEEGFKELKQISFSVVDATGDADAVADALATLALNTLGMRTSNGVGWDLPSLEATTYAVTYTTTSGLSFGWRAKFNGLIGAANTDHVGWDFWIKHPAGAAPAGSTLAKSALAAGWQEVKELEMQFDVL